MTAIDRARIMYTDRNKDFDAVLAEHLHNGIVVSSPQWFLMLRAVQINNQLAWLIECVVGNLKDISQLVALKLPLVAFCRVKTGTEKLKVYRTDRLLKLIHREVVFP